MNDLKTVDINTDSYEQLVSIPGIGPALAKRIIDHRPYQVVDDLVSVQGIGPESVEKIRPYLTTAEEPMHSVVNFQVETPDNTEDDEHIETVEAEVVPPDGEEEVLTSEETDYSMDPDEETDSEEYITESVFTDESEPAEMQVEIEELEEKPGSKDQEKSKTTIEQMDEPNEEPGRIPPEKPSVKEKEGSNTWVTRSQLTWAVLTTAVISILLTVALILGILAMVNGGLQYTSMQEGSSISNQVSRLDDRTTSVITDINGIRTRLDTLETVAGRVSELEISTKNLQQDLETVQENITEMQTSIEEMQGRVDELAQSAQKFQGFLDGLRDLLNTIDQPATTE